LQFERRKMQRISGQQSFEFLDDLLPDQIGIGLASPLSHVLGCFAQDSTRGFPGDGLR
jgi:hypothetical protein